MYGISVVYFESINLLIIHRNECTFVEIFYCVFCNVIFRFCYIAAAAETALAMPHVRVRGLMTIPPVAMEPHGNLAYFEKMRWLYVDINAKIYDNRMEYLSMGMSGDFADAIRCGSNMIRVGTAIFGARDYTK